MGHNVIGGVGRVRVYQLVAIFGLVCVTTTALAQDELEAPSFPDAQADYTDYSNSSYDEGNQSWLRAACDQIHCWKQDWHGNFDIGINGTAGNNDSTNLAATLMADREVGSNRQSLDMFYFYTHADNRTSANNLYARYRNEMALADSPYNWYYDVWYQYNQFGSQFFGFNTGVSMNAIDDGTTLIAPRIGVGAPDLYVGLDLQRQLSQRQRVYATIDYYPDFDFSKYRLNLYAAYELTLDQETGLNLTLAAWDWFNSETTAPTKMNDLMYMMLVGWSF